MKSISNYSTLGKIILNSGIGLVALASTLKITPRTLHKLLMHPERFEIGQINTIVGLLDGKYSFLAIIALARGHHPKFMAKNLSWFDEGDSLNFN